MSFYDLIHLADSSFVRAEPARKSGSGFIKMLKKSFGKGKHKRNRKLSEMTSSPPREISSPREIHQPKPDDGHPPDIWLSQSQTGIQKPVPRKPPRRTRSKSGSGKTNFWKIFSHLRFFKVHAVRLRLQIVFLQAIYLQQPRRMTTSTYPNLNWHHVTYRHITWDILVVTWESQMANHLHQNNEFILSAIKIHFHSTFSSLILKI